MTDQSADPEGPSPFAVLRTLTARHIDELVRLRDNLPPEMSLIDHERFSKALNAMIKNAEQIFSGDAVRRKTGEELKKEDDAIRAEFARRLAAMLRGRQAGSALGGDTAPSSSPVSP